MTAMVASVRVPVVDADSAPFWDAISERRLVAQQCDRCRRFVFYPRAICPHCHSATLTWQQLAGTGTVYSFTVSRRAPSPEFEHLVPYVVALIDLDEGCRMMSNVVGPGAAGVRCGDAVRVRFETVAETQVLPVFELVEPPAEDASQAKEEQL
jgi:uncharacterized OB-fold protein